MPRRWLEYSVLCALVLAGALFLVGTYTTFEGRVTAANELGKSWLFANMKENGLFVYSMDPSTGEVSGRNNAIRQLMASRVLAQESARDAKLVALHSHNLDFLFEYWYRTDGAVGYVFYNDKSKLGANAMLLRALVYSPFFDEYAGEARALAEGILLLQDRQTGEFEPWYRVPEDYAYDKDYLLAFYSGEALLALVEYFEHVGEERWLDAAKLSADFYIDRYVTHLEEYYYPAYVPWHTLAYNRLYKITGEQKYADAVFIMNDKLLELQDRGAGFTGRFYNPSTPQYGSPHASSDAVYTEGLAYAYEVALLAGDTERVKKYRDAIEIAVGNLEWLQYQEATSQFAADPARYVGALRTRADSFWIRVDTTQHAVDAFTKLLEIL